MTAFLRITKWADKAHALRSKCEAYRLQRAEGEIFEFSADQFLEINGAPFCYWVNENIRYIFKNNAAFESQDRIARRGANTNDDFRFIRLYWECESDHRWKLFCKGGSYSPYYSDVYLKLNWFSDGQEVKSFISEYRGKRGWGYQWSAALNGHDHFFRPGITWPLRTNGLSFRAMPRQCIFGHKGPVAFVYGDDEGHILALMAIMNSKPFKYLVSMQLARTELAQSYEVGLIQNTPVPRYDLENLILLCKLSLRSWKLTRILDSVEETSHAFILPEILRSRAGNYNPVEIEAELEQLASRIDDYVCDLYGLTAEDKQVVCSTDLTAQNGSEAIDENEAEISFDQVSSLLSWCVGCAFGRFDWRLATGQREVPAEPDPFDALPAKGSGVLSDGAEPLDARNGVLVDDQGHPQDLSRLIEEVLDRVQSDVPSDLRRWIQRDFFPLHLRQYSRSRRKAPIYWPLSTPSGSYTLWFYYPDLTAQTLFTAVNDFVEPKLEAVRRDLASLQSRGDRTRDEDRRLESLFDLKAELDELRSDILQIAPTYRPNHNDGVQITAAPLWSLFRHKPWHKILKDTWEKLEKGEYDWAHLAMGYWPERVREKCKSDRSLAIAHDLEHLYEPPPETGAAKTRKRKGAAA